MISPLPNPLDSPTGQAHRRIDLPDGFMTSRIWPSKGPVAHFLHANGMCAGTYTPFLNRLAHRLTLWASDLRGHGNSSPAPMPITTWQQFGDDMAALAEIALPWPIVGMGHSLGAVTTALAARKRPELFTALVLIDPVILPPPVLLAARIARWLGLPVRPGLAKGARRRRNRFDSRKTALERYGAGRGMFARWKPEFVSHYVDCALGDDPAGDGVSLKCQPETEAQIYESIPDHIWRIVREIDIPTLIVRGETSNTLTPTSARRLGRIMPSAEVVTIPGAGHFIPMERPEALAQTILDWIERQPV